MSYSLNSGSLDRHITGNYGEDQYRGYNEDAEELIGARVWITEEDDFGVVDSYEDWEDADEDGRYGGTTFFVSYTIRVEKPELMDLLAVTDQIDYWSES